MAHTPTGECTSDCRRIGCPDKEVEYPMVVMIEAILMENGEVIHFGKSLGFINKKQRDLVEQGATKKARGHEIIVAIGKDVA